MPGVMSWSVARKCRRIHAAVHAHVLVHAGLAGVGHVPGVVRAGDRGWVEGHVLVVVHHLRLASVAGLAATEEEGYGSSESYCCGTDGDAGYGTGREA